MKQRAPSYRNMCAVLEHLVIILGDDFMGTDLSKPLTKQYVPIEETTDFLSDKYVAHQYIVHRYGENGELYV